MLLKTDSLTAVPFVQSTIQPYFCSVRQTLKTNAKREPIVTLAQSCYIMLTLSRLQEQ